MNECERAAQEHRDAMLAEMGPEDGEEGGAEDGEEEARTDDEEAGQEEREGEAEREQEGGCQTPPKGAGRRRGEERGGGEKEKTQGGKGKQTEKEEGKHQEEQKEEGKKEEEEEREQEPPEEDDDVEIVEVKQASQKNTTIRSCTFFAQQGKTTRKPVLADFQPTKTRGKPSQALQRLIDQAEKRKQQVLQVGKAQMTAAEVIAAGKKGGSEGGRPRLATKAKAKADTRTHKQKTRKTTLGKKWK